MGEDGRKGGRGREEGLEGTGGKVGEDGRKGEGTGEDGRKGEERTGGRGRIGPRWTNTVQHLQRQPLSSGR